LYSFADSVVRAFCHLHSALLYIKNKGDRSSLRNFAIAFFLEIFIMTHTTHTQQAIFASFVVDEQTIAQAQLEQHITQQGEVVVQEEFTIVEITCYDYEIYVSDKLIASIRHLQKLIMRCLKSLVGTIHELCLRHCRRCLLAKEASRKRQKSC
jgi:hypothetical protein